MKYLLVFSGPYIMGGIATLMARMSEWLLARGNTVTVLVTEAGALAELLPRQVRIIQAGPDYDRLCLPHVAARVWRGYGIDAPDVIKSFDGKAAWIGSVLGTRLASRPKLICGNYGPGFFPPRHRLFRDFYTRLFARNVIANYHPGTRLLMSEEQRSLMRRNYGSRVDGTVWPLPVDARKFKGVVRAPRKGLVVSVGRLSPMKEYNLHLIEVVSRLAAKGFDIRWEVYGDGPFKEQMLRRINELSLSDRIFLKGTIEYQKISEVFQQAYVFVGMGTAAIEAALCGVPSIVALAHDQSGKTYGMLHRWPFANCGELAPTPPDSTIERELEQVLSLDEAGYRAECERCLAYAMNYDSEKLMQSFVKLVEAAPSAPARIFFLFFIYPYQLLAQCRRRILSLFRSRSVKA